MIAKKTTTKKVVSVMRKEANENANASEERISQERRSYALNLKTKFLNLDPHEQASMKAAVLKKKATPLQALMVGLQTTDIESAAESMLRITEAWALQLMLMEKNSFMMELDKTMTGFIKDHHRSISVDPSQLHIAATSQSLRAFVRDTVEGTLDSIIGDDEAAEALGKAYAESIMLTGRA